MKNLNRQIDEKIKHEWIMREYGSFEDSGESKDHVVSILRRSPKGLIITNNATETKKIKASALYVSCGYDDTDQIEASNIIAKFAN